MAEQENEYTPTTEEEIEQVLTSIEEHIAVQQKNIDINEDLKRLKKKRAFKNIIEGVFIETGKTYLWDNIKEHKELDLLQKGSAREGNIEKFEQELQARLILERFLKAIEEDAEDAAASIQEAENYRHQLLNPEEGDANA